jgi:predicted O-methyltransferase YrrM
MNNMNNIVQDIIDDFSNLGFLSHNYGSNGKSAIGMWKEEQSYLVDLALQSPQDASWIEVGSFQGGSACLLATAIRHLDANTLNGNIKLYCVDIDFNGHNNAFNYNAFKRGKFGDIISLIETNSKNLASHLDTINDLKIGFVWLDGWHSYKAVMTEFDAIKPYLVPGSIVAFHDAPPRNSWVLPDATWRAHANHAHWMSEEIPDINVKDKSSYHKLEQSQNFEILPAVAYILDKNPEFELLPLPSEYECDYTHIAGHYKQGGTSPQNAVAAIRRSL